MEDSAHVIRHGVRSRWPMMAIPGAKQPHGQVDCLGTRNRIMAVEVGG
jgi:hypothetical protein